MTNYNIQPRLMLLLVSLVILPAHAVEYSSGHRALEVWDEAAMQNVPQWINVWLMIMAAVFFSGVFFIKNHIEARWVLGGFVFALLFFIFAVPALNLIPLSGLMALIHLIFWTPGLVFLLKNKPFTKGISPFNVWAGLATVCILFSFIFDVRDAFTYLTQAPFVTG